MKKLTLTIIITLAAFAGVFGQITGGAFDPKKPETSNSADRNSRGVSRVNPTSLAMEFSLPLASYPGRGGNSLPVGINYSSKVWQMKNAQTWWYGVANNGRRYVTDTFNYYAEMSAGGWSSTLQPPRLETMPEYYNVNGRPYGDSIEIGEFISEFNSQVAALPSQSPFYFSTGEEVRCRQPFKRWDDLTVRCETFYYPIMFRFNTVEDIPNVPNPNYVYYVKRLRVVMPDGSSREFLQNNNVNYCGTVQTGCTTDYDGTYLATDGSGIRLVYDHDDPSTMYLPDGSKYTFPANPQSINGHFADTYIDVNGNKTSFTETFSTSTQKFLQQTIDTMGRTITEPIPHNWTTQTQVAGVEDIGFPAIGTETQDYSFKWENLKPIGCETSTSASCVGHGNVTGGTLEDQTQKLFYESRYFCNGSQKVDLLANPNDYNDPANEVLFPVAELGIRPCNGFGVQRDANGDPIVDVNGLPLIESMRFNPVVLSEVTLPNGQKYEFKYNRFGEITKVIYPTGSYETFQYAVIDPVTNVSISHNQLNRGVVERRTYDSNAVLQQRWTYQAERNWTNPSAGYKITTIAPTGSDASGTGVKTERRIHLDAITGDDKFGFGDPLVGAAFDEKTFDENGAIRSRTLTEYTTKDDTSTSSWGFTAKRDARPKRSVTISFEPGSTTALATYSETDYDETGSTDPEFFFHLNVKRKKAYNYAAVIAASVDNEALSWSTIESWFPSSKLASVSETDYSYDSNYKARGIIGRPTESRVLDPTNTNNVLAKSQLIYDETAYQDFNFTATNWVDPASTLRGNVTTTRTWVKETDTWLDGHTMYDNFGNVRKVWDASGDANKFVETQYSSTYNYAYPTSVTTPAPDPTNTTGTNQTSTVNTAYDFNTGLPMTVTNDFGQITGTEYADPLLRPTRSFAVNFTAPESQTSYNDGARTVTVRKQLDGGNWDEAVTFADTLGRTVKTQAKDSQGDVFVETHYDLLGRVERVTNPYRVGDTVYWSKTRYDVAGRAVETYAPATIAEINTAATNNNANLTSLGVTSFAFSDLANYVGTVVTTKDASGRRGRSITNALGQLIRVDEPTGINGADADADLGSLTAPFQPTSYKYDVFGKMVEVTQGVQKRWFKYDALGRLLRVTQPEQERNPNLDLSDSYNTSGHWTAGFAYDLLGNVVRATDANGVNIINDYDRAGRVIRRCYTKPNINTSATTCTPIIGTSSESTDTPAVSFLYDGINLSNQPFAKGKLTKVTSSVSETQNTMFDNFGRVTESKQITDGNTYTSKYTYSFTGALIQEEYPSGRIVKNEYESDGDIARIFGSKNATSTEKTFANTFRYTPDGKIESLRLGNGLWESAKFNNRMQPTEINLGRGVVSGDLWKLTYEYGELESNGTVNTAKNTGNIGRQTVSFNGLSHPFVQSYKYDALQRLTEAKETKNGSQMWLQQFGYDLYGNRTSTYQSVNGSTITSTPAVDANTNRFTSTSFEYDNNGNITRDTSIANASRTFVFNADNKQRQVLDANGNPIGTYYFDGEGKRVKKVTQTETTVYVFSGGKLVAEYTNTTPPQNPTVSYTATDLLGSPRVLTDSLGAVVSRRDFLPFGEEVYADEANRTSAQKYTTTGDDGLRKRFTGYEKDKETQLDFAEARMYENRYGRFTAVDPLLASGKSGSPQTLNRYVYVMNSPLRFSDPTGLQAAQNMFWIYKDEGNRARNWIRTSSMTRDDVKKGYVRLTESYEATIIGGLNDGKVATFYPDGTKLINGPLSGQLTLPGPHPQLDPQGYVNAAVQNGLSSAYSQGKDLAYAVSPDYGKFQFGFPGLINGEFAVSKDYRFYFGFSKGIGDSKELIESLKNFNFANPDLPKRIGIRPSFSFTGGYFLNKMNYEERDNAMTGPGVSGGFPIGNGYIIGGNQSLSGEMPTAVEFGRGLPGVQAGGTDEVFKATSDSIRRFLDLDPIKRP